MKEWHLLLYQFDELHPELQKLVYKSFFKFVYKDIYFLIKDRDLTEDLIQESFLKILSAVHKHEVSRLPAWIRQICRNQTIDFIRRTNRDRYLEEMGSINASDNQFDCVEDRALHVYDEVENKIRDELLHQSIAELRPEYRELIFLYYIEEMTHKEIAAALNLSEHAVSQKLYRARKKLLQQFQQKWVSINE